MPRFLYQARDDKGQMVTGVVAALSIDLAGRLIHGEGKYVINLKQVYDDLADTPGSALSDHIRFVRRSDVIYFAHQMAVMIDTGVPITEALECVSTQTSNLHFKAVLESITDHVRAGGELSIALGKHPAVFPPIMISLIRASEISGTMGVMLERISSYLDKEERTRRQVKGALTYPFIMISMAVIVTIFLLIFILPRFAAIYANRQAVLPAPTRMLMSMSDSLTHYWYFWLAGLGVSAVLAWLTIQTGTGRLIIDTLKLRTPVLRNLYLNMYVSRACRALGTMLNAGVSVLDAVDISRQVTPNIHFQRLWDKVVQDLQQGLQLSDPLCESRLIPRSVAQMVRSGEKSGRLPDVLQRLAGHTEEEFDHAVKNATQYIEPIMVVVMGGIVGFIAISLLLPIFNVSQVVSK